MSKSSATAIASRYATAIFALAGEAKKAELVVDEISQLANAMQENDALRTAMKNPLIARETKGEILLALAKKAHKVTAQSLETLAKQGRADLLPQVAESLRLKLAESKNETRAIVESARPLSAAMQKQLVEALSTATGKEVQLELKENPALLGGVAIQIGSRRLDASLSAALSTMKRELLAQHA